jgi:hypothetical protein
MRLTYVFRRDASRALWATPKRMFWSLLPVVVIVVAGLLWSAALPAWGWSALVAVEAVVVSLVGSRLAEDDAIVAMAAEDAEADSEADE